MAVSGINPSLNPYSTTGANGTQGVPATPSQIGQSAADSFDFGDAGIPPYTAPSEQDKNATTAASRVENALTPEQAADFRETTAAMDPKTVQAFAEGLEQRLIGGNSENTTTKGLAKAGISSVEDPRAALLKQIFDKDNDSRTNAANAAGGR